MVNYPEHEKLKAISDKSQEIGQFIDWLQYERGIVLAEHGVDDNWTFGDGSNVLWPTNTPTIDLLADYFDIDLEKIENEKSQMLAEIRAANG